MKKLSAGLVVFDLDSNNQLLVLLVHPGGPFWKNKDEGAWSIPKGEYIDGEDPLLAAKREFTEETGNTVDMIAAEKFTALNSVKLKSGKTIQAFAVKATFEKSFICSNTFEMEWPPKSGKMLLIPEVDKAEWFTIEIARLKINPGQVPLLEQLSLLKN